MYSAMIATAPENALEIALPIERVIVPAPVITDAMGLAIVLATTPTPPYSPALVVDVSFVTDDEPLTADVSVVAAERKRDAVSLADKNAIDKAMNKGHLEVYTGISDSMSAGAKESQFIASYMFTFAKGIPVYERTGEPQCSLLANEVVRCLVQITGKIIYNGKPDRDFRVETGADEGLNRPVYEEGDDVSVSFYSTKDAYVHLIYVDEERNAVLLFPNYLAKAKKVKAGEAFTFPPKDIDAFKITATLPENAASTSELFHVILTKNEPLFGPEIEKAAKKGKLAVPLGNMENLSKKIASLDRDEWTMQVFSYEIRKKPEK